VLVNGCILFRALSWVVVAAAAAAAAAVFWKWW